MTAGMAVAGQPAMVRSMTGFARVRKSVNGGEVSVSVKSLNHRALDIHIHTGLDLSVDNEIRTLIKAALSRGHVEVRIGFVKTRGETAVALNRALFEAYLNALTEAASIAGKTPDVDLNAALRVPGMVSLASESELKAEDEPVILAALAEALESLNQFREREGNDLRAAMLRHTGLICNNVAEIEGLRGRANSLFLARLEERLAEVLRPTNLDPQRVVQEAAILTDRSDISEETSRLRIHAGQLDKMLGDGGEIGKKADFLLQEMNREANTILSKTSGIGEMGLKITELGLAIKADIEKIREQTLNIE